MIDTEVYLGKLSIFGRLLREQGLEVSPKETEDACSILSSIELDDKEKVRAALKAVYAKSREEQLRFDKVFDSFFISEDTIRAIDKKHLEEESKRRQNIEEAQRELGEQNIPYSDEEAEAYASLSDDRKEYLKRMREKYSGNKDRGDEKLYDGFIHSLFTKYILEEQMNSEDAGTGIEALDPEIGMMFRDISEFSDIEIPKAVKCVQDIAAQINGEISKSKAASSKSSVLDFRRTIRKGLETGGSFYRIAYRKKKRKRKQLLVLCDVSASMIQFSEFALRFIQALNEASGSSRIILFSENFAEADPFHLQNMDLFREYVKETGIYGRGTDMGKVLKSINDERPSALSPSTVLIILSDTKSINLPFCLSELRRAKGRAGKLICLNPIPQSKWKYSSSITETAQYCDMLPCSTLAELGSACRRLLLK